jgi:hypothetical protein
MSGNKKGDKEEQEWYCTKGVNQAMEAKYPERYHTA